MEICILTNMNISEVVLYDDAPWREHLLPLVATRPVSDLRVGILTIAEKWEKRLGKGVSFLSKKIFSGKYPMPDQQQESYLIIKGGVLPDEALVKELSQLNIGESLFAGDNWLACAVGNVAGFDESIIGQLNRKYCGYAVDQIPFPESVFRENAKQISLDFQLLTQDRDSFGIGEDNHVYGEQIFVEDGVSFHGVTIDARKGPVYIGKDTLLEPGTYIYDHVAICTGARLKTGSRLYPNVTVGPQSTVCGEINNTVIWGDSSKGHDGYLGCSVVGEGCNLGAGTTNSNLRNDWKPVALYDYALDEYRSTGLLKCGAVIGDHAMLGIQSVLTTGTVIGVGAQVATSSVVPRHVPDFSWLTDRKSEEYRLEGFMGMLSRKQQFKNSDNKIDSLIFEAWYVESRSKRQ